MASTAIVKPKMSMTMTEGEVVEILIAVGDEITSGQLVAVVGTDKTDMEVESDHAGQGPRGFWLNLVTCLKLVPQCLCWRPKAKTCWQACLGLLQRRLSLL